MTRFRKYLLVPVTLAAAAGAGAGCGSQQAGPPPQGRVPTLCGRPITATDAAAPAGGAVVAAAALFRATVVVRAGATGPSCRVLTTGGTVVLAPGQKVQFVANETPAVLGARSAVRVTTGPGPVSAGPGGGTDLTPHVVVTVTAVRSGSADVEWTDCSGTGC